MEKRAFLPKMYGPTEMQAMEDVRRSVDGKSLANRGKMLPPRAKPSRWRMSARIRWRRRV